MKNQQNSRILHEIWQKNTFSRILGAKFPALKLRVSGLDPNTKYVIIGEYRSKGAIVLNKLFMRLFTLLYSISLDE